MIVISSKSTGEEMNTEKKKMGGGEMVYTTYVVDQKLFQVSKSHWENKN